MKKVRILAAAVGAMVSLTCPHTSMAATSTPITTVTQSPGDGDLARDLRGVPTDVKTLILDMDQQRDHYLTQQHLLEIKLRHATTAQERESIRDQLQANRQEFLTDLKGFRQELRDDLKALTGKISHAEFGRIVDAAHDAGSVGGHSHRGH